MAVPRLLSSWDFIIFFRYKTFRLYYIGYISIYWPPIVSHIFDICAYFGLQFFSLRWLWFWRGKSDLKSFRRVFHKKITNKIAHSQAEMCRDAEDGCHGNAYMYASLQSDFIHFNLRRAAAHLQPSVNLHLTGRNLVAMWSAISSYIQSHQNSCRHHDVAMADGISRKRGDKNSYSCQGVDQVFQQTEHGKNIFSSNSLSYNRLSYRIPSSPLRNSTSTMGF